LRSRCSRRRLACVERRLPPPAVMSSAPVGATGDYGMAFGKVARRIISPRGARFVGSDAFAERPLSPQSRRSVPSPERLLRNYSDHRLNGYIGAFLPRQP
jgi:hypothetical protein